MHKIQNTVLALLAIVVVTLLLVLGHSTVASAQSTANTLRLTPLRTDVTVKPGANATVDITITNQTDDAVTVRPSVNDFVSGDESGRPALILDDDEFAPSRSLKRFVTPLSDVTIPARKGITVKVAINVPSDAKAGGYFGAIRFSPTIPDSGGQVNLSASVASLILLTVPGDVTEKLVLTDYNIVQDGRAANYFHTTEGIGAAFRFQNEGGLQEGPFGKITVKKGDEIVYEYDFNISNPRDMVLPDGARKWEIPFDNIEGFGLYTVYSTFTYGQTNQTIESTKTFWILPWFVLIGAAVALLVLVGLIILVVLLVRRKRRRRRTRNMGYRRF